MTKIIKQSIICYINIVEKEKKFCEILHWLILSNDNFDHPYSYRIAARFYIEILFVVLIPTI